MRVMFLIRELGVGGAERQLVVLAKGLAATGWDVSICPMYAGGALEAELEGSAVALLLPRKSGRWDLIGFFRRLRREAKRFAPDAIHGYMGGANEIALLLGRSLGRPVVWGIRVSDLSAESYLWSVGALFRMGAGLSRAASLIIANSERGRDYHIAHGYAPAKFIVIPNGVDTGRFAPDPSARASFRASVDAADEDLLVGLPARLDPMKDHETFVRAAALVHAAIPRTRFLCIGSGDQGVRTRVSALADELGLTRSLSWLPATHDIRGLYNGLDLVVSASAFGEGFPNVIAEAMACETPVVGTRCGDCAQIIGDARWAVSTRDPGALAAACSTLLGLSREERERIGAANRARILAEYSVIRLVERTRAALESVAPTRQG